MRTFEKQRTFYEPEIEEIRNISEYKNLDTIVRAAILLHDIGKPIQGSAKQHEHTPAIHDFYLQQWHFGPSQVKLARSLIDQDSIGECLQGKLSPEEAVRRLSGKANEVNLTPKQFFNLQKLFYIADASYYRDLKQKVFTQDPTTKQFQIKSPRFEKLAELIESHAH